MIDLIIGFAVAGILFITEYILCTKLKNPLWGRKGEFSTTCTEAYKEHIKCTFSLL